METAFNVRGEPIVGTPREAFRCFMGTDMDILAIGNYVMRKSEQDPRLQQDYRDMFEPD